MSDVTANEARSPEVARERASLTANRGSFSVCGACENTHKD
jgi:hypothetical protein